MHFDAKKCKQTSNNVDIKIPIKKLASIINQINLLGGAVNVAPPSAEKMSSPKLKNSKKNHYALGHRTTRLEI